MRIGIFLFTLICIWAGPARALPDQVFDQVEVTALEDRLYNPKYDVTANLSILPLDAFYKGFAGGVSYTHSYASSWSWEILNANLDSKSDTNLKRDLVEKFKVEPDGILDFIDWYALTSVVYTPGYTKTLMFNRSLLYGSFSLVGGAGWAHFSSGDAAPMFGGGLIFRVFHSKRMSSKLDTRLYFHNAPGKSSDNVLIITYGLSFELGDHKPLE